MSAPTILSAMPLSDWRGALTFYRGPFDPLPYAEHEGLTASGLRELVCPASKPQVRPDKTTVTYFTPGLLQDAPLVNKTREKALAKGLPQIGKQRSDGHVTSTTVVVMDEDGIAVAQGAEFLKNLKALNVSFFAYTSHSHGRPDKPGLRMRVIIFLDRTVSAAEYPAVHGSINRVFFDGTADKTGAKLCQQQGVWATSPDRKHLAHRWGHFGGVLSVDGVLSMAPPPALPPKGSTKATATVAATGAPPNSAQINAAWGVLTEATAIKWLGMPDKVRDGEGREAAILRIAGKLRAMGASEPRIESMCTTYNTACIEPPLYQEVVLDRVNRFAHEAPNPDMAAPVLFATARDHASAIYRHAAQIGDFAGTKPAWTYLAAYHPKAWNALRAETEVTE